MGKKIRCKRCGQVIESTYVHDYNTCHCGAVFIDGGNEYTRIGWLNGDMEDWVEEIKEDYNDRSDQQTT